MGFMPKSNDSVLVTGAGDYKIRVHNIANSDTLLICSCHYGRVKRVATAPAMPFLFWSASEDGLVMQYDLRQSHSCKLSDQSTVLVNLTNHLGRFIEAKCINVNPRRPELIAVGANDAYVRMYDRRMIKLSQRPVSGSSNISSLGYGNGDPDNNVPLGCVQYFVAGHLKNRGQCKKYSTTYLTFSYDGNELLVNMGAEQIYLFDINDHRNSRRFIVPAEIDSDNRDQDEELSSENDNSPLVLEDLSAMNVVQLSPEVEVIHQQANKAFEDEHYADAISMYNEAISLCPTSATLYANRASTYMKRAWEGDTYDALRDCRITLALDPNHVKAHFRLARCLFDLKRVNEAHTVMENFMEKFPDYTKNSACRNLRKDIKDALNSDNDSTSSKPNESGISKYEKEWQKNALDFKVRLCGHCNTVTDIKEANFFGEDSRFIIAGSDDGSFFTWDRYTTNIVRVLKGDSRIVNCLQPHPSMCLLATSGIDQVIRLWSPLPEDGSENVWEVKNANEAAIANYLRMNSEQFELMPFNIAYMFPPGQGDGQEDNEGRPDLSNAPLNCRPS
ncbi:WD and tetratricopeptide repeats protein 1 isoform X2 [Copidosoma floridanum]|uniref:WD and tetratricopeptide repeats protein 1 isoform X2 n=1 Tax=Copidosoma floridanum TaxID=29053 RepID=UPI0006C97702|nr:WD and tetratricopeptide repeats protein 1 isoform X2 [Copidosoma floridanum]